MGSYISEFSTTQRLRNPSTARFSEQSMDLSMAKLDARSFYGEYHGHKLEQLEQLIPAVRNDGRGRRRGIIFLVGDSTLDNKHWLGREIEPACNGYEHCLQPAHSTPDVAYWINRECEDRGLRGSFCCVNAAIEESTLGLRAGDALLPHDTVVQRHIDETDVLVCSCGGNDIALRPTVWTAISMVALLMCPMWLIRSGWAPGLGHFIRLFRDQTKSFVQRLIAHRKPRLVVVCMLYYLDKLPGGSWADYTLQKLGYDTDPEKLQLVMRQVYHHATRRIQLDCGTPCEAVPLYEALDGNTSSDYVQRVEPSSKGGLKMAKLILNRLLPALGSDASGQQARGSTAVRPPGTHDVREPPVVQVMPKAVHLGSG